MNIEQDLKKFGRLIAHYEGTGSIRVKQVSPVECDFQAGQYDDGSMMLICRSSRSMLFNNDNYDGFEGVTKMGHILSAPHGIVMSESHILNKGQKENESVYHVKILRTMKVIVKDKCAPHNVRFKLTNLLFHDGLINRSMSVASMSLDIDIDTKVNISEIKLQPDPEYIDVAEKLQVHRNVGVTTILSFNVQHTSNVEDHHDFVQDICYLLSLARGTNVQYIGCDVFNKDGQLIGKYHFARATKSLIRHPLIGVIQGDTTAVLKYFIEITYKTFVINREKYRLPNLIDAYIDGRSDSDYLELRGVKLAVVGEMLKHNFINKNEKPRNLEFIIVKDDNAKYYENEIIPKLQQSIKTTMEDVEQEQVKSFIDKRRLLQLNRRSFRHIMMKIYNEFSIKEDTEIKLFIECRNSLIHKGEYYCKTATIEQKANITPLASNYDEYLFLSNFIGRMLLIVSGYEGPYIDWSSLQNPKVVDLKDKKK